jgi:hypothetical protein
MLRKVRTSEFDISKTGYSLSDTAKDGNYSKWTAVLEEAECSSGRVG